MSKYLLIGREFQFNRADFVGPVVASDDAIYFVIQNYGFTNGAGGALGGLLGAINEKVGSAAASEQNFSDLSVLPRELVEDPEWPIRERAGRLLTVPKSEVCSVHVPGFWLNNRVYVTTNRIEISTVYNLFRRGKIQRFLAEKGWTAA